METYDYKQDIINSRVGCLGGSDGRTLAMIADNGYVPKSAYKRLAVCKGLIEQKNVQTRAMLFGDYIENQIYKHLAAGNEGEYESNPLWISERYSRKNCHLICHPDIVREDNETKTLYLYEVKTTKFNIPETRQTYRDQLYIERELAKERARTLGAKWTVKTFLVHYDTNGINMDDDFSFDPSRITIHPYKFATPPFHLSIAMNIVDGFLETFTEYYDGDEVDADLLPEQVKNQFAHVSQILKEIKEREMQVEEFKARLYQFLTERNIKKVSCDDFSFTVVAPSESKTVDYKKLFFAEIESKTPRKARKLKEQYEKVTRKKGYVQIKVKQDDDE